MGKSKGCIKTTRGDWTVRRRGKGGAILISKRTPSDREREANKQREQRRRVVASNIYAGLREYGQFRLPKHPNQNDILIALCEQAGYQVAEDGSVSRKGSSSVAETSNGVSASVNNNSFPLNYNTELQLEMQKDELSLDLTLSYKYM